MLLMPSFLFKSSAVSGFYPTVV